MKLLYYVFGFFLLAVLMSASIAKYNFKEEKDLFEEYNKKFQEAERNVFKFELKKEIIKNDTTISTYTQKGSYFRIQIYKAIGSQELYFYEFDKLLAIETKESGKNYFLRKYFRANNKLFAISYSSFNELASVVYYSNEGSSLGEEKNLILPTTIFYVLY